MEKEKTIFEKIISGEIPCYKIYEDDYTFAFLDISPQVLGHTLIVPKKATDYVLDVEEPEYSEVFKTAKKIGKAIHEATGCKRVGMVVAGYGVPHFHLHLVPTNNLGDLDYKKAHKESDDRMQKMAEKIRSLLK